MSAESPDTAVRDYIIANRGTYTREAIGRALLAAGHSEETIAAAWADVGREAVPVAAEAAPGVEAVPGAGGVTPAAEGASTATATPSHRSSGMVRLAMRTIAFWITLIGFLVAYVGFAVVAGAATGSLSGNASTVVGILILLIPLFALGGGIALAVPERTRPIGLGLLGALAVLVALLLTLAVLAFIAVVIIFGICVVSLSRGTSP